MKIAAWNVRGLGDTIKKVEAWSLVREHSIKLIGLIEAKLNKEQCRRLADYFFCTA